MNCMKQTSVSSGCEDWFEMSASEMCTEIQGAWVNFYSHRV